MASFNFGSSTAVAAPATQQPQQQPTFGFGTGGTTATVQPQPQVGTVAPIFGATTVPAVSGLTTTSAPSIGFGGTAPVSSSAAASSSLFSFPQSTTTTAASIGSNMFGSVPSLGATQPANSAFTFNTGAASTTSAAGQNFLSTAPTFGGFGANSASSSFLTNKPSTGFGSFGTGGSLFGANQQQQQQQLTQQQQAQQQTQQQPIACLFAPKIYNDERDNLVGQFNAIQAFWGTGKAYYSAFAVPYQFTDTDQFNRFKAICYSEIAPQDDKDSSTSLSTLSSSPSGSATGNVAATTAAAATADAKVFILLRMPADESALKTSLLTYEHNFRQLLGANYTVKLELKNVLPDAKAVIAFAVIENATAKPVPESQLRAHFSTPTAKQQLGQIFSGTFIELLFSSLSKQELDAYLSAPPKGIDERVWTQAKMENPDPTRFTPLPLIGFGALNNRFKMQEREIQQQQQRLKNIIDSVTALESDISQFKAKFEDCRRKHAELSYQVLRRMTTLEVERKRTLPIQADEDKLRANLEAIQSELSVPTKFQGCLNELMSQLRQMQIGQTQALNTIVTTTTLDKTIFGEYRQFLAEENEGIMNLVQLLKSDIDFINRIEANGGVAK